jgi:hypothetical protein
VPAEMLKLTQHILARQDGRVPSVRIGVPIEINPQCLGPQLGIWSASEGATVFGDLVRS